MKQSILNFPLDILQNLMIENDFKKFNASQIFGWIYKKNITDFEKMSNISIKLKEFLSENYSILTTELIEKTQSVDKTIKFILETREKFRIESVIIFDKERITLCVSSQIGCPLNCKFCRTGNHGFERNLSTGEIIEQIIWSSKLGFIPSNIVFMGMGEPLLNFDNLLSSLYILFEPAGFNYSPRKVTISTSGICDKILELDKKIPYLSYAVSLHSADNSKRTSIMPVNKKYNLEELGHTLRKIKLKPRQHLTIEYIIIPGLNNSEKDALLLVKYLKNIKCKINLIAFNPFENSSWRKPSNEEVDFFRNILKKHGLLVNFRISKGQDIKAACGQLAFKTSKQPD
ncbi:MAG: 23S rRNA (adenine(2503)-C(2))-methyltransferase RlmN [Candidatus Muiribacteriota bacterium]